MVSASRPWKSCRTTVAGAPPDGASGQRLALVVGDQHAGGAVGAQRLPHVGPQLGAQLRVQGAERLVQQHQRRPGRQRPGHRDPLLLAAGELVRHPRAVPGEADQVEHLLDPAGAAGGPVQAVADVVRDGQVREQRPLLRHDGDAAAVRRDVHAVPEHRPAGDRDRAGCLRGR
ncbi:hypothetical protein GCM10010429_26110 [Micromonospora olivasterospora]